MAGTAMDEFLRERGHGVLAFNTAEPYAVPVSYGYDAETRRCFLQLVFGEESQKREHLEQSDGVCLVVHEWQDLTDWRSVVMIGSLRELADAEESVGAEAFGETAALPDMTVFDASIDEVDVAWYELLIESIDERAPTGDVF